MKSSEPNFSSAIVLDETLFPNRNPNYSSEQLEIDGLIEFAKKTFRRYEESNQRIDTFSLRLKTEPYARFGFATEWTLKALKLGATDLTFRSDHPNIIIPLGEVFGNKNVVRLCLESSTIIKFEVTKCPRLKYLTLSNLEMKIDSLFGIISCCPSVENMSLSNINDCDRNNYGGTGYDEYVEYVPPPPPLLPPPPTLILHDLRSLVLCDVDSYFLQIETLFFDDLSSKFPNLKHLTLGLTKNPLFPKLEVIQNISSTSLETLNIMDLDDNSSYYDAHGLRERERAPRVEFDVPSIRKFTFESKYIIPDVSFKSISGYQWESHVSITNDDKVMLNTNRLSTTWFRQLSKFLTNLRGSKIHLCLHVSSYYSFNYDVGELDGLDACEVEELRMDIPSLWSLSCKALLDALFRICRPKIITLYPDINAFKDFYDPRCRNNDLFICGALQRAMQEKSSLLMSAQFMYGLRDLEEIDAQQLLDEVWKPQPLGSILADLKEEIHEQEKLFDEDYESCSISKIKFRILLKWKS